MKLVTFPKLYLRLRIAGSSKQNNIRSAITEYDQNTCIRFVPRTQETDYITFVGTGGCSSYIGQVGGEQEVSATATKWRIARHKLHSSPCIDSNNNA